MGGTFLFRAEKSGKHTTYLTNIIIDSKYRKLTVQTIEMAATPSEKLFCI